MVSDVGEGAGWRRGAYRSPGLTPRGTVISKVCSSGAGRGAATYGSGTAVDIENIIRSDGAAEGRYPDREGALGLGGSTPRGVSRTVSVACALMLSCCPTLAELRGVSTLVTASPLSIERLREIAV